MLASPAPHTDVNMLLFVKAECVCVFVFSHVLRLLRARKCEAAVKTGSLKLHKGPPEKTY